MSRVIIAVVVGFVVLSCSQNLMDSSVYQKISLQQDDTLIEFRITEKKVPVRQNARYHWYRGKSIEKSMGGYSGQLLDGEYEVFDANGNLIEKGAFKNGLKSKTWVSWDGDRRIYTSFRNGLKNGPYREYEKDHLMVSGAYRNDLKHGKFKTISADTTMVQNFRNGELSSGDDLYKE